MIELLHPAPGALALDVATGGGHTARALADAGCRVVTCDATRAMRPHVLCDAQRLPFFDITYDIICSRIAPHHFPDLDAFVRESARALRPGGRLYVFDLTTPEERGAAGIINRIETLRDPSHVESYAPSRWRAALDRAGLVADLLETTTSTLALEPWLARAKMTPERERECRSLLAEGRGTLGGYGLAEDGTMRVLRVEILATRADHRATGRD